MKFSKPSGDKWESRIIFPITSFVVVSKEGFVLPDIFGMELNGIDKCPLCGSKFDQSRSAALSLNSQNSPKWPWQASIYQITQNFIFKCAGTLIKSNAVITSGEF